MRYKKYKETLEAIWFTSVPENFTTEGPTLYEIKTMTTITIKQPTNAPMANLLIISIFIQSPINPMPP